MTTFVTSCYMLIVSTVRQIHRFICLFPHFQLTHLMQTLTWWKEQKYAREKLVLLRETTSYVKHAEFYFHWLVYSKSFHLSL